MIEKSSVIVMSDDAGPYGYMCHKKYKKVSLIYANQILMSLQCNIANNIWLTVS